MGTQDTVPDQSGVPMNRAMRRMLARTKVPRKQHNVQRPGHNPVNLAIGNATTLTRAEREDLLQPMREGFDALRKGVATYAQWAAVSSAITVSLSIEDLGVVKGLRGHFQAAERAIDAVWARVIGNGESWGRCTTLYFDEISAIREAIDLHDFQLQNLSAREIREAGNKAARNVRAAGGRVVQTAAELSPAIQEQLL